MVQSLWLDTTYSILKFQKSHPEDIPLSRCSYATICASTNLLIKLMRSGDNVRFKSGAMPSFAIASIMNGAVAVGSISVGLSMKWYHTQFRFGKVSVRKDQLHGSTIVFHYVFGTNVCIESNKYLTK